MRGGAEVARETHALEVPGSSPAPAPNPRGRPLRCPSCGASVRSLARCRTRDHDRPECVKCQYHHFREAKAASPVGPGEIRFTIESKPDERNRVSFTVDWWDDVSGQRAQCFRAELETHIRDAERKGKKVIFVPLGESP